MAVKVKLLNLFAMNVTAGALVMVGATSSSGAGSPSATREAVECTFAPRLEGFNDASVAVAAESVSRCSSCSSRKEMGRSDRQVWLGLRERTGLRDRLAPVYDLRSHDWTFMRTSIPWVGQVAGKRHGGEVKGLIAKLLEAKLFLSAAPKTDANSKRFAILTTLAVIIEGSVCEANII